MPKTEYRTITDNYLGYEAQYRKWWMFWWRAVPFVPVEGVFFTGGTNTAISERQAQEIIEWHKKQ